MSKYKDVLIQKIRRGPYIPLYIPFVGVLKLNAATLLGELITIEDYLQPEDGWFWRTQEKITERTSLTKGQQERTFKILLDLRLILKKRYGRDRRNYFRINYRKVNELVDEYLSDEDNDIGIPKIDCSEVDEKLGDHKIGSPVVTKLGDHKIGSPVVTKCTPNYKSTKRVTKKIYKKSLEDIFFYHLFPTECTHLSNEVFKDAWEKFCEYRAKKNWTERAAKGIIFTQKGRPKTLIRYEPIIAAKMLLRSTNKKWTGVFEIDDQKQSDKGIIQDAYPDISSIFRFNCRKGAPKLEEELRTLAYKFGTWYAGVESQSPGIWKKLNYGTFKTSSLLATRYEMWLGEPEQDWFKAPWYPKALWPTGEMFRKFIDDLNTRFGNLDLTAFIKRED